MKKRDVIESAKNVIWAFVFALALWLVMVQSQQKTENQRVQFNVLPGSKGINVKYVPTDSPPRDSIQVRGSASDLARRKIDLAQAHFILPEDQKMGINRIPYSRFKFILDPGVAVDEGALTGEVEVELAKEERRRLAIDIDMDDKVPPGWMIQEAVLEPRELEAVGPIDLMSKDPPPKLRTEHVSIEAVLSKFNFDRLVLEEKSYPVNVSVRPPDDSGIKCDARPVKLLLTVKPKPKEAQFELEPSFFFSGPTLEGLPFKLTPYGKPDKVTVRVSGHELDLIDAVLPTTKAKFVVFVRVKREDVKADAIPLFDVVVVPPPGIELLGEPDPRSLRFKVEPLDTASGSAEK
jgi:hypothetical protein